MGESQEPRDLDFRILGPMVLHHGGEPVRIGTPKQLTILAMLLLRVNEPVTVERLVDEVWPDGGPASAWANMTSYLSGLRRGLAGFGCRLVRRDTGYALHTPPESVDASRFAALAGRAAAAWAAGQPDAASLHWATALRLWRGEPFEGVPVGAALSGARAAWIEQRLATSDAYVRALLHLGRGAEAVASLRSQLSDHPLREQSWLMLIAALHLSGNSAGALNAYTDARTIMADHLGVDPGGPLRCLHQAILTDDRDHLATLVTEGLGRPDTGTAAPPPSPVVVPAQLPAAAAPVVGRDAELALLDQLAGESTGPPAVALVGTAGVGKTTLAVAWAHRIRDRFPDGQLFADLRGYDTAGPAHPATVLRSFLEALGAPTRHLPADLDGQVGLYRSLLAQRRVLVVLDNARDGAQVRPLLPAAPGCHAVITSRDQLRDLVAGAAARPVTVELLTRAQLRLLLAARIGTSRVDAEPAAVDTIAEHCAGLPLALAVVAARALIYPRFPLAAIAAELQADRGTLDADVRSALSWSVGVLTAPAARVFRLSGTHPGTDFTAAAAASRAGLPLPETRSLLTQLVRAHLLHEHTPGRYRLHDLLRAYAGELHEQLDTDTERTSAARRTVQHYLHTAVAAALLIDPHRDPITPHQAAPGVIALRTTDREQAIAWFRAQRLELVATVEDTAARGWDEDTWQLAWSLLDFLDNQGYWRDWLTVQRSALTAARRRGDRAGEAHAHRCLGRCLAQLGSYAEAETHYLAALASYEKIADPVGQAHTRFSLGWMAEQRDDLLQSLHHHGLGADLYRRAAHQLGLARSLNATGWVHARLGDYLQALSHCEQALELSLEACDTDGQAAIWDSIGYIHHHLGDHHPAIDCYKRSLTLYRAAHDQFNEADVLIHLGDTYLATGRRQTARNAWTNAFDILDHLGHPNARQARNRLEQQQPPVAEADNAAAPDIVATTTCLDVPNTG